MKNVVHTFAVGFVALCDRLSNVTPDVNPATKFVKVVWFVPDNHGVQTSGLEVVVIHLDEQVVVILVRFLAYRLRWKDGRG